MTNSTLRPEEQSLPVQPVTELNAYGYYVLVDNLYYPVYPYDIQVEFGFNKLGKLRYVPADADLRVIVYMPEWMPDHTVFFAQDLDVVNHDFTKKLEPLAKPVTKDIFEITLPALHEGQLLIIRDYKGLYGVGVGSISDALVELFNTTDAPAAAVLSDINQALKSFPENLQLPASKSVWESKEVDDKSNKVWDDVLEKLEQYNSRDDRPGKLVFADDVEHEIGYYLSLGDNLPHKEEADKILAEIDAFKNKKEETAPAALPDKSLLGKNITVYESNSFTLCWVEIGDEYLLRFQGLSNEFDQKVLRHKKQIQNEATGAFILSTTEITANNWNTFTYENDGWGGLKTMVYPPLIQQQEYVYKFNDTYSDSPEDLYNDYCKQQEEK
ncbi:hypothetical protein LVD15_08880 [Fulvivirga maritima]|uniref:hypothetical protein n=1 Tax=Fulvivirga maritima TaxID=2904247 RepID=UPI001F31C3C4|nr:hypothetical protein [Fulvivirga maritima]UII28529.1 hypothetical protein LVD15_08880 [Fulvivirga maritima]